MAAAWPADLARDRLRGGLASSCGAAAMDGRRRRGIGRRTARAGREGDEEGKSGFLVFAFFLLLYLVFVLAPSLSFFLKWLTTRGHKRN
jgi:hypothetical protein